MGEAVAPFGFSLLPSELADHVAQLLARQLYRDVELYDGASRVAVYCARELGRAFRRAVGHLWQLFAPKRWVVCRPFSRCAMRADAVPSFVEGVMRFHCTRLLDDIPLGGATHSSIYATVYEACSVPHPHSLCEPLHAAIGTVGRRLVRDGPLLQLSLGQRGRFQRLVHHMFRFLDAHYVARRAWLPTVERTLGAMFDEAEA